MGKKNAHNPIREKWVISNLRKWDKEHPDLENTISDINNEISNSADCSEFPNCLDPESNRCYVRGKVCENIKLVKQIE